MKSMYTSLAALFCAAFLTQAQCAESASAQSPLAAEYARIQADAAKGNERALFILADLGRTRQVNFSKEESRKAAEQSAKQNNPLGLYALAQLYRTGVGVERDRTQATELAKRAVPALKPLAEAGDVWAQMDIGLACMVGFGTDRNTDEAVKWFRKAAEQGFALGQAALGRCYIAGVGVPKDAEEGLKWCRKACEQGFAEAFYMVGRCYLEGNGVPKSAQNAAEWYRKAAEGGLAEAQYALGTAYAVGKGVEQSFVEAAKWFQKAAEQDHVEAQRSYGALLKMGKGVQRNTGEGMRWLRTAALHGSVVAQMILANVYLRGDGIPRDVDEAKRWLFTASNSVDPRYRTLAVTASKTLAQIVRTGSAGGPAAPPVDSVSVPPVQVATEAVHPAAEPEKAHSAAPPDAEGGISGSILFIEPNSGPVKSP